MGEFVNLEVDRDAGVGTIRLDRPPMNALSRQVWREIEEAALAASTDDDVGAIVVWGGPDVFAAGADIKEFPSWDYQQVNDFRFAAEDAVFGQPEIKLGLIPGAGGTQRLPRLVGVSKAKELVFTGRNVEAEEALAIGLADAVHPAESVYDEAHARAARYADGPYALRLAKRAIDDGTEIPLDQGLRLERSLFAECFATDDAEAGVQAFVNKERAEFTQH